MKTTSIAPSGTKESIVRKPADQRGLTELGWLHSRHSFSFGGYFDPDQMGFRSLRVINDDIVEAGGGFGSHPHRDAEIFSYVIDGELEHKDSMGNGRVIKAGDLQYMSAGSGVVHSEFNPSPDNAAHFLQVWLKPNVSGGAPRYAEKGLGGSAAPNALTLLFAGKNREGAVEIRADAEIYFGKLDKDCSLTIPSTQTQGIWIHVIGGELNVRGETLSPGDAVAVEGVGSLEVKAQRSAEFLAFVLA